MMIRNIQEKLKIQWQNFSISNEWEVKLIIPTVDRVVSNKMIPIILSQYRFRMGKIFLNENKKYTIGYGIGDIENTLGLTENEAYSLWIEELKRKEKILRKQLPIPFIEQSKFDAILSLYFSTGTWKSLEGNQGIYDTEFAIKNLNWELFANMLSDAKNNGTQRRKEAKIVMLGDYTIDKDRSWLRTEGTQFERIRYNLETTDKITKNQIENAYYRQLGSFLPGMSDLQKRKVIAKNQ
jgi:hypothetical protein